MQDTRKLPRTFYQRNTLLVARALLGNYLVRRLPSGELLRGKIVETEAYAGLYDPGSHTYQDRRTERNQIWYGEGGFAYVYQIYGLYVCLGIITEPNGIPGTVLVRALEPTDGIDLLTMNGDTKKGARVKPALLCAGPSKLCIAMQIDKRCNGLDLCGDELYLEEGGEPYVIEEIVFTPRINIDYAEAGALSAWRYYVRHSPAISKTSYEPLRDWRLKGYPSLQRTPSLDLFTHLAREEEQAQMSTDVQQLLHTLPKVELHLHLEGCVTPATLRSLCTNNRKPVPLHLQENDAHHFGSFAEFAYSYYCICQAIVREQDFALIIADVANYLKRNNILYAEISWSPFLYLNRINKPLHFEAVMEVMNEALIAHGVADRVNFLIDIQRDHGLEAGAWVYQQAFAAREDWHIVGVGLTGQEEGFPPSEYQDLYRLARERGLGCTAHAGEYGTAEDIRQCVHHLGVSRIGHGISAINDRALMQELAEQKIHLEVSLTSNVRLGRVPMYSSHPVQALWRQMIPLGLNSDDPGLFSCDLSQEYSKAVQHCGFSFADLQQTLYHSIAAAFLSLEQKHMLQQRIDQDWRSTLCPSFA